MQGQLFINGFNVGRYWPTAGPQVTLFIPAGILRASPLRNHVVLLELEKCPACTFSAPRDRDDSVVRTGLKFDNGQPSNSAVKFRPYTDRLDLNTVNFVDKPVISGRCSSV